jgi:hypothetical protein
MANVLRVLLWAAVIVAPGGVLLLPLLVAHDLRARSKPATQPAPVFPPDEKRSASASRIDPHDERRRSVAV